METMTASNMTTDKNPASGDDRWQAVQARDAGRDGDFVYGVRTTGIYCRPSCASRRPRRQNVAFFPLPEAAKQAGFRACLRCRPDGVRPADPALRATRRVCRMIDAAGIGEPVPTLAELAAEAGLSPWHLQRSFKGVMGISPRQYAEARRTGRFRRAVRGGDDVTGALYDAGYGSSSRLYERAGAELGMTPATYRRGGAGAHIRYAIADCPLGRMVVAATVRGICFLGFGDDDAALAREVATEFPAAAEIRRDDGEAGSDLGGRLAAVLARLDDGAPHPELPLDVRATAFQRRVWHELTLIPAGQTRSYSEIAAALGKPGAQRAVGRACATNPVSLLIPCHRAVREDGGLGGYRWGLDRKRDLLRRERG